MADKYAMRHLLDGCTHFLMLVGELSKERDAPNYVLKWLQVWLVSRSKHVKVHSGQVHDCMQTYDTSCRVLGCACDFF